MDDVKDGFPAAGIAIDVEDYTFDPGAGGTAIQAEHATI
jgi:hypothetical protein